MSPLTLPQSVSADNGPLSPDLSRICLRWPIVSGAEPYPLMLAHCLWIWAISAYTGPLSLDLGHICLRWPIVSGSGPYLLTLAHCLWIWAVSAYAGSLSLDRLVSGDGIVPPV